MVVSRGGSSRGGSRGGGSRGGCSRGGGSRGRGRSTGNGGAGRSTGDGGDGKLTGDGAGARLTGGRGGKRATGGASLAVTGGNGGRKENRGKLTAVERPAKQPRLKKPPTRDYGNHGASTSIEAEMGIEAGTPPARAKSTVGALSSHDSNPVCQPSPPSQGTPQSQANGSGSRTNLIPLQFPGSSQQRGSDRQHSEPPSNQRPNLNLNIQPHRHQLPVQEDEDDEIEGDDLEDEEDGGYGDEDDDVEAGAEQTDEEDDEEGEDYEQLLLNLLGHPGRQSLPLLSPNPIPGKKTLW